MLSVPAAAIPQGELDRNERPISRAKICVLGVEHDDLDAAIDALIRANMHDDQIIARLKKRKLQIRDRIAGLAAEIPVPAMGTETTEAANG